MIIRRQLIAHGNINTPYRAKDTLKRLQKKAKEINKSQDGVWYGFVGCYIEQHDLNTAWLLAAFNK